MSEPDDAGEVDTVRSARTMFDVVECLKVGGGMSVSGPSHRLKGEWFEEELPDFLLGAANELELNIEYS
ncbi:hypothetical protein SAMN05216278_3461 [Halopelagius longus]|uniref:Uncharacterized protein n=1 Tax=Halopelagius longus TaxID=1236180 RepID=A0A1H1G1M0_9EURY|nr:hypothetical protein SAMN05216278_3461 [Halopelagius longus]